MSQVILAGISEGLQSFLPLIGIVIVFYLFFIRPQNKQKKEAQSLLDNMTKGDILVTAGGIHGKLFRDDNEYLILEVDTNTKIKVDRTSISLEMTKKARESKTDVKV